MGGPSRIAVIADTESVKIAAHRSVVPRSRREEAADGEKEGRSVPGAGGRGGTRGE